MANNYVLGRGKVFFDPYAPNTTNTTGEDYLGNTPEFSITIESEKLDHFNSDEGVRVKDESVLLELNRTGSFTCDNISPANVARFFLGDADTVTDTGITAGSFTITGAVGGRYYQIGTDVNPSGVRKVTINTITDGTDPLVAGTDYTLDSDLGRIYIIPGGLGDGANINISDYDTAANTRTQIVTAANAEIEGALRFVAFNAQGDQLDYYMPYVRLTPSGDFALKGDEWQVLSFDVEILKKDDTTEAIYIDGRPVV
jgi:hypothetical protein